MKWLLALVPFVAAAPALPNVEITNEGPKPGDVKIRGVTYGGTGCPQGSVGTLITADQSTLTLIYDSYVAQYGSGVSQADTRKNCLINVELLYPGGFQYSIAQTNYRGYAAIDKGVTGTLKSTYYFSGQTQQASAEVKFVGPISGDYVKSDNIENTSTVWSPCGASGALNINSQVRLEKNTTPNPNNPKGLLTTDSTDLKFTQVVSVQWQKCTPPKQ